MRLLLLAGTGEARRLAARLVAAGHDVTASLAGATKDPAAYPCPLRIGGFGGADGLAAHLAEARPDAVIDATHPFAAQISAHALTAARRTGTAILRLDRPPWTPRPGEIWCDANSAEHAAEQLPPGARAFVAAGRAALAPFAARADIHATFRLVDPPDSPYPGVGAWLAARPPFDIEAERALFERLAITHLVVKNAGGAPARTKVDAAAALGLPIIVIRRPEEPDRAETLPADALLARLADGV